MTRDELKARVVLETNRDDIGASGESVAALDTAFEQAIENYADEGFWFNRGSTTAPTVASTATVAKPDALRIIKSVAYNGTELRKVPLGDIQHRTETGQPRYWADNGSTIRLHPIPGGVYSLSLAGIAQVDPPAASESNIWTDEAKDLIVGQIKFILCRGIFRDAEGAIMARGEVDDALTKLRRETRKRAASPLRTELPGILAYSPGYAGYEA